MGPPPGRFNGMKAAMLPTLFVSLLMLGCNQGGGEDTTKGKSAGTSADKLTKLGIVDVKVGTGPEVKAGDSLSVRYTGTFKDGTKFDSNEDGDKPDLSFVAGPKGMVIKGWQEGVIGMKVGGERKLSVPSDMAYGAGGQGPIPANSDLYFTIKLLKIQKPGDEKVVKAKDIKVGSGRAVKLGDTVEIQHRGTLDDGKTEIDKGKWTFKVGKREVIPGIDQGIIGMQVGGTRRLDIPPLAAYGPLGREPMVPAKTNVIYTITVLSIK